MTQHDTIGLLWLTQSYQFWVTTLYIHLCEAPGCFRACMYLHKLGMLHVFYFTVQNPTPLQHDFPRILQATSLLSWNQLQSPLQTTVTTLKCCMWDQGSKVYWARAQEMTVILHRDNWLQNNSIHNMESMKYGKEKTARGQLSTAPPGRARISH